MRNSLRPKLSPTNIIAYAGTNLATPKPNIQLSESFGHISPNTSPAKYSIADWPVHICSITNVNANSKHLTNVGLLTRSLISGGSIRNA